MRVSCSLFLASECFGSEVDVPVVGQKVSHQDRPLNGMGIAKLITQSFHTVILR